MNAAAITTITQAEKASVLKTVGIMPPPKISEMDHPERGH
jgi:hypothetical protein